MGRAKARNKKSKRKGAKDEGSFARFRRLAWNLIVPEQEDPDDEGPQHAKEIKGLLMIGFAMWLSIAMLTYYRPIDDPLAAGRNLGGEVGFYLADIAFLVSGLGGYVLAFLLICWGAVLVAGRQVTFASLRILGAATFVLSISFLFEMGFGETLEMQGRLPYGPGGWVALEATPFLSQKFGEVGLWILMVLTAIVSFMLATEMAFSPALVAFKDWADERREERGESLARAIFGWTKQLVVGLWDFVRGAHIGEEPEPEVTLTPQRKSRAKAVVQTELEDLDDEEEEEEDEEEDDEEEEEDEDEEGEYEEEDEYEDDDEEEEEYEDEEEEEEEELEPAAAESKPVRAITHELKFDPPTPPPGDWTLPPTSLLVPPAAEINERGGDIDLAARMLEQALASFRVEATVVGAQVGPTVILFELEVSQGTRMNKVTQLSQEIAAALRAQSVRIIAPIPGKSTVGIEVPNDSRRTVRISELVSQSAYDKKFAALPLFIGVDAEGHPIVEDLTRMPHLLVAGTTGSGKSVCINCILASFLLTRSPHDVKLILIDPKMVELQPFSNIPHLMLPVVTDMRQATNVLNWAVEKMEGRYELFKDAKVKNIKGYNKLSEQELQERMGDEWNEERTPRHVPYIVVVIDEFADLMMASKKEAEQAITRLAQKSRAVGIHVILATQRPSTDVITGVIKGNLPTRIAFQVASKVDSRVILDSMGAEKLLGGGDMLYNPPATSRIRRVQGAFLEDEELQRLIDFVCTESAQTFSQELVQAATGTAAPGQGGGFEAALGDEMWDDAVRVVLKSRRGSASLLQRALGVGYTRASRLLDMMTEAGIVSEHKGSKAREVLMTIEDWDEQNGTPVGDQGATHE